MDPATAFQVTCGAIQLVGVGILVASTYREVSKAGSTSQVQKLCLESQRLSDIISRTDEDLKTRKSLGPLSPEDANLHLAVQDCINAATELRDLLNDLVLKNSKRPWEIFGKTVRNFRYKSKVDDAQAKLEGCLRRVDTAKLASLWRQSKVSESQLEQMSINLDIQMLQQTNIWTKLDEEFQKILDDLNAVKLHVSREAQDTRDLIHQNNITMADKLQIDRILNSLAFPSISAREEEIVDANSETFRWIFDVNDEGQRPWHSFTQWLKHQGGMYWINGKAGSGKSTLMKFIVNEPDLDGYLQPWRGQIDLFVGKFYFWRSGTREQRSISGLLKTIVSQFLSRFPGLACSLSTDSGRSTSLLSWTERRLFETVKNIVQVLDKKGIGMCLFIDGLDEFEGDTLRLVEFFEQLVQHEGVKICASSRPEPIFFDRFRRWPQMCLQDLTQQDMHDYAETELYKFPHFRKLSKEAPGETQLIIETVVSKAEGVFLWTALAVGDLKKSCENRDILDLFFDRLESLELGLDKIFLQLLGRIDRIYHDESARILKIVMLSLEMNLYKPLSLYHFALMQKPPIVECVGRCFGERNRGEEGNLADLTPAFEEFEINLLSRTAGLILVTKRQVKDIAQPTLESFISCGAFHEHNRIALIHRSVVEFLSTNLIARRMLEDCNASDEQCHMLLGIATTECLQDHIQVCELNQEHYTIPFYDTFSVLCELRRYEAMPSFATEMIEKAKKSCIDIFLSIELSRDGYVVAVSSLRDLADCFLGACRIGRRLDTAFYAFLALEASEGLLHEHALKMLWDNIDADQESAATFILDLAVDSFQWPLRSMMGMQSTCRLIMNALERGANPNALSVDFRYHSIKNDETIWEIMLSFVSLEETPFEQDCLSALSVVEAFLSRGADKEASHVITINLWADPRDYTDSEPWHVCGLTKSHEYAVEYLKVSHLDKVLMRKSLELGEPETRAQDSGATGLERLATCTENYIERILHIVHRDRAGSWRKLEVLSETESSRVIHALTSARRCYKRQILLDCLHQIYRERFRDLLDLDEMYTPVDEWDQIIFKGGKHEAKLPGSMDDHVGLI